MNPTSSTPTWTCRAGTIDAEGHSTAPSAVTVLATGHRSEFGYDEMGRRVEIIEKDPDAHGVLQVTSDKKYLWDGVEMVEEQAADGSVLRSFYVQGFIDNDGTVLFYTKDHLGSIRELTDAQQNVRARYEYDPYGRMTKVSGDRDSVFTYTGHFWHAQSGLNLALYRAYDPNLGRWISRDPAEEFGGLNVYGYVGNNPINQTDPEGLCYSTASEVIQCKLRTLDAYLRYTSLLNEGLIQTEEKYREDMKRWEDLWEDMLAGGRANGTSSDPAHVQGADAFVSSVNLEIALRTIIKPGLRQALRDYVAALKFINAEYKHISKWYNEEIKKCKLCDTCPGKGEK